MSLAFVNYAGEPVKLDPSLHAKVKPKKEEQSFHNGWRVVGIPAGAEKEARESNERVAAMARNSGGAPIKPFDPEAWLKKYKKRAVRSKPYEIRDAAETCKEMAEKAGWTHVDVVEIKKEVRGA